MDTNKGTPMKTTTNNTTLRSTRSLLMAGLLLVVSGSAVGQALPQPKAIPDKPAAEQVPGVDPFLGLAQDTGVNVPLRQVTLYSSGVGFFEHAGPVPEDGRLELRFRETQINDILKSLEVFGADTATVSFDTAEPLQQRLAKFGIDVSGDTSLPAILRQLRGEVVTVHAPGPVEGRILDVSKQVSVVSNGEAGTVPDYVITLVTEEGMKQVQLRQIQHLKLGNEQLSEELNKALIALAGARNQGAREVDIRLGGELDDDVMLRYLVEAPIWKTSYRLGLDDDGEASLQGWAIVENKTDSDWEDVVLTLASGRPVSFVQDLYSPLHLSRPVVTPTLYASLMPTKYNLGFSAPADQLARNELAADKAAVRYDRAGEARSRGAQPASPQLAERDARFAGGDKLQRYREAREVASAALSGNRGELFQYTVKQGVDLPRGRSAMLPILKQDVEIERLSIYDQATHGTHPMRGIRLINGKELKLPEGPMTILDNGAYAGDATLPFTGPEDKRLLTYSVDLEMQVTPSRKQESRLIKGIIAQGVLKLEYTADLTQTYAIVNESAQERSLWIAHPINQGWKLETPEEPTETTESQYRFEVAVAAGQEQAFKVNETRTYHQHYRLVDHNINQLTVWSNNGELDEDLRKAIAKAASLKSKEQQLRQQAQDQRNQTGTITQEQRRVRDNMARVNRDSQLYQRYVTKLTEQEDKLEALQTKAFELDNQANAVRDELAAYLKSLSID